MLDKVDLRVSVKVPFRRQFQFLEKEVRWAGQSSVVRRSNLYQGVIDLRPFGIEAMLHACARRPPKNHKLELFETGLKTLDEMAAVVLSVFDVDVQKLWNMRLDFTADIANVTVEQLRNRLRVRFKRSIDERGELEYANVGGRTVTYFRYGKAPNCVRVYDKVAERKANLPDILKRCNPDADIPTFEQLFGFPEDAVITRIERQCGGNRIPPELETFGDLRRAAEFHPFKNIEIVPEDFPFPSADEYGVSERLKLIGTATLVQRVGLQQARAELNRDGNGQRLWGIYENHLRNNAQSTGLDIEAVVNAYQISTRPQIESKDWVDISEGGTHNILRHEIARRYTPVLPKTRTNWWQKAECEIDAGTTERISKKGCSGTLG